MSHSLTGDGQWEILPGHTPARQGRSRERTRRRARPARGGARADAIAIQVSADLFRQSALGPTPAGVDGGSLNLAVPHIHNRCARHANNRV